MNRNEANEIRAAMGLAPFVTPDAKSIAARKRAQDANRAAHAQLQRDIKAKRNKGGKS